jgi:hypothetical protein
MSRMLGIGILLLASPTFALGQNRPAKKNKAIPPTSQEYAQIKTLSAVVGRLGSVDTSGSSGMTITLEIPYQAPATGPEATRKQGYQAQLNSLQRQCQAALQIRNPVYRSQRLAQLATRMQQVQALGNVAATTVAYKQYDMEGIDKLVVRRLNLPLEYDNKCYPKKYSKEDIDRLKGKDKTLPGYEAGLLDLQTSQTVQCYLAKSKPAKKDDKEAVDPEQKPAKKGGKDKQARDRPADLPQVRMIVILAEPPDGAANQKPPARKKKQ